MENRLTDRECRKHDWGNSGNVKYSEESGARLSDGNERKVARKLPLHFSSKLLILNPGITRRRNGARLSDLSRRERSCSYKLEEDRHNSNSVCV